MDTIYVVYCEQTGYSDEDMRHGNLRDADEHVDRLTDNWNGYTYLIREETV